MKRTLKKEHQELLRLDRPEIYLKGTLEGYYWKAEKYEGIHNGFFDTEQEAIEWADKACEPLEDLQECMIRLSNEYDKIGKNITWTFYGFLDNVYKGDWKEEIKQAVLYTK